jgi:hypothetical protein
VSQDGAIDISMLSLDDLRAMQTIVAKYSQEAAEVVESGELRFTASSIEASSFRRR